MTHSLGELSTFVQDALRVHEAKFVPENIQLGLYTFLPWYRTGVAAAITAPATDQPRAVFDVTLPVEADGAQPASVDHTLVVRGPGDVLALDSRQIIRRYPKPGAVGVEDNYLAHVEFDRPDLPWVFSPFAPAQDRLATWLALVVLERAANPIEGQAGALPPKVHARVRELQPIEGQTWAWAHAQVVGPKAGGAGGTIADRLGPGHAAVNLSRLVCPRRLQEVTEYVACLVPSFEAGVRAGLEHGLDHGAGTLDPAWRRTGQEGPEERIWLPVYDHWTFTTGKTGDFESLAERLDPIPAPSRVGRRTLDTKDLGGRLQLLAEGDPGRVQVLRGPLVSPQSDPNDDAHWPPGETQELGRLLNRPDDLAAGDPAATFGPDGIPIVSPPLYARHHAAVSRVGYPAVGWFGQLNLDPRHRVVAGVGTRVVQSDQEQLMQSAWAQFGALEQARRRIGFAQVGRFLGQALHDRQLGKLPFADLLQVTRRTHGRVPVEKGLTVHGALARSAVPGSAASGAFRRITRPLGPLARHGNGAGPGGARAALARLVADGDDMRDFRRPYRDFDGVASVSDRAARAIDPKAVAQALGRQPLGPEEAARLLLNLGKNLSRAQSVPDALTPEALQGGPREPDFRIADFAGKIVEGVLGHSRTPMPDVARQRLGRVLETAQEVTAGFANEGLIEVSKELARPDWPTTPERSLPPLTRDGLLTALDPKVTVTRRIRARIGEHPEWLPDDWFDDWMVEPIMAAPNFPRPMYKALDDYDRAWLLPGLEEIKEPDFVTLLETNAAFIEAFMVGLSHEMASELLWRNYPTDQRGTYFRQFWREQPTDPAQRQEHYDLAQQIHAFTSASLGDHVNRSLGGKLVLLIRGELIRRYPDAIVLALQANGADADKLPLFSDLQSTPGAMAPIIFHAPLAPDIVLTGFDLTKEQVDATPKGRGWWFIVAEHPSAPRFGLDATHSPEAPQVTRKTLAWSDLPVRLLPDEEHLFLDPTSTKTIPDSGAAGAASTVWGRDGASIAHLLLQDPVRAAFEGKAMLGKITGTG